MSPRDRTWLARLINRACGASYRLLLLAYPKSFRRTHGRDAAALFAAACEESWHRGGLRALVRRTARAPFAVVRDGIAERVAARRPPHAALAGVVARANWFTGLSRDTRDAVRAVLHRPRHSAAIVVTLGLGLGASVAAFSVIDVTLVRPLPYRDLDRVAYVRMRADDTGALRSATPDEMAAVRGWTDQVDAITRTELRAWRNVRISTDLGAARVRALEASGGYLDMLGARPLAGRLLTAADDGPGAERVVVLGPRLWRTRFGARADLVGRTVRIDGEPRRVVGILEHVPSDQTGLAFDLVESMPGGRPSGVSIAPWGVVWLDTPESFPGARAALASASVHADDSGERRTAELVRPPNDFWDIRTFRDQQLGLIAMVTLLPVIALVNAGTLLASYTRTRVAEFSVRAALGASRLRLSRLPAIEGLLLASAGAGLGLLVAAAGLHLFSTLDPGPQLRSALVRTGVDGRAFAWAVAMALVAGPTIGLVPAYRVTRARSGRLLHESGTRIAGGRRGMSLFLGVQVAISTALLLVAGLVGRGFLALALADPGFAADRILSVQIALPEERYASPADREEYFDRALERVRHLPGVVNATLGYGAIPPADMVTTAEVAADDGDAPVPLGTTIGFVRPEYFGVMGIPVIAGAPFDPIAPAVAGTLSHTPVVVSASLARSAWPSGRVVGRSFTIDSPGGRRSYMVSGIAQDVDGLGRNAPGCRDCRWHIYAPLRSERRHTELVIRLADDAAPPVAALRAAIVGLDPEVPADEALQTAADSLWSYISIQRFQATLFSAVAALAAALVALGLVAVVTSSTARRTREMGIRLALGARPRDVQRLLLLQGLAPTLAGIAAGTALGLVGAHALRQQLLNVTPFDPPTMAGSAAILGSIAIVAMWAPARRASQVDPAETLRPE